MLNQTSEQEEPVVSLLTLLLLLAIGVALKMGLWVQLSSSRLV